MIGSLNNQRPTGSTAIACDSGIPISGRTSDTGTYEILKLNPDGSLATGGSIETQTPNTYTPGATTIPIPGLKGVNVTLIYELITPTQVITDGLYNIQPQIIMGANAGGSVNMALIKVGSTIDNYILSRSIGVDAFTPAITDFVSGFGIWWHNLTIESMGGIQGTAQLTAQNKTVRLETGNYKLFAWVHTAITTTSPTCYYGFNNFTKIG